MLSPCKDDNDTEQNFILSTLLYMFCQVALSISQKCDNGVLYFVKRGVFRVGSVLDDMTGNPALSYHRRLIFTYI